MRTVCIHVGRGLGREERLTPNELVKGNSDIQKRNISIC